MKGRLKNGIRLLLWAAPALTALLPAAAGDWQDGLRLLFLALPGCWLAARAANRHRAAAWLPVLLWWLLFLPHILALAAARLFLDSSLDAYFIVQAVANTTVQEAAEFVGQHLPALAGVSLLLLLSAVLYAAALYRLRPWPLWPEGKMARTAAAAALLLVLAAYAVKPNRALFPPVYWSKYAKQVQQFRTETEQHRQWHRSWQQRADTEWQPMPGFAAKQTWVLALNESLSSHNFGVCGYPRQTTPNIQAHLAQLDVFCRAYSPEPSTIGALRAMLGNVYTETAPLDRPLQDSMLAYARAAGFKIFWISNQDDVYLASLFGSFADQAVFHNKRSGRSSISKDEELLPYYQAALNDPAPRKLIVLHLIGAHPNYAERYPEPFARFPSADPADQTGETAVAQQLAGRQIGFWVKQQRDDYDNSILYQDWLFGRLLELLQNTVPPASGEVAGLVFVSDHGNEVGHERDYAGHSPGTEAGYRVPLVVWQSRGGARGVDTEQPVDAALLGRSMLAMMGIAPRHAVLKPLWPDPGYRFEPPSGWPYWQKKH